MKKMKMAATVAVLTTALIIGLVYASWILNRPILMTGTIVAANDIQVYSDAAGTLVLTGFDYGNIAWGDVVTKQLWICNIGQGTVNTAWNVTGMPAGIICKMCNAGGGSDWPSDAPIALTSGYIMPLDLTLNFTNAAPFGPFSFTLNVYATA